MRQSLVLAAGTVAALALVPSAASASVFVSSVTDETEELRLRPYSDVVSATVRYDDAAGHFSTRIVRRGPAVGGVDASYWVEADCIDASGRQTTVRFRGGAELSRDAADVSSSYFDKPAETSATTPTTTVSTVVAPELVGLRCRTATVRSPQSIDPNEFTPPFDTVGSFPFAQVTEATDVDVTPAPVAVPGYESRIVDAAGPGGGYRPQPEDDILDATVRYDDVAGRFSTAITFGGSNRDGFAPHRVIVSCTDAAGAPFWVQLGAGVGAAYSAGPSRPGFSSDFRTEFAFTGGAETSARTPTTVAATVVDRRLAGLRCNDAAAGTERFRTTSTSRFYELLDVTDAFPFVRIAAAPPVAVSATTPPPPAPAGSGGSAPTGTPTVVTKPVLIRPSGRLLDRSVRRGTAFRVRYRGEARTIRARYRRAGRTITKRFTVRAGVARVGTRALSPGTWRVSILDGTGKVGSGTVRVRR